MTRLIAGSAGGRRLKVPASGVRPTGDRAREGLFNSLGSLLDLDGARVLDLYAGSGALGLEALSRGAGAAQLVDADRDACDLIRANAGALGLRAEVTCSPVVRWLAKEAGGIFGWIFLDPPYASHETGELDKALDLVAKKGLVDASGLVVAEHDWRNAPEDRYGPLALFDRRRYGQTAVSFYRHEGQTDAG